MARWRILAASAAILGVGASALAQSVAPAVEVPQTVILSIVGGALTLTVAIAGWGLRSYLGSQFEGINHGIAQLHARVGELKGDHGAEISQLRIRTHEIGNHTAATEAKLSMHLNDKGAHGGR